MQNELTLTQWRKIINRARLVDISRETGFSVNTVSLALKQRGRMSVQTRSIINEAAERLHYVPNGLARSLVTNENNSIGVIVRSLKSPVLMEMIGHIEDYLQKKSYCTIIMGAGKDLAHSVDSLLFQNVGGMLIYPELSQMDLAKFHYLRSIDFPFVLMSSDGKDHGLDTVYMDRQLGGYKATTHLASLGHKRIGFIAGDNMKLEGYRQALAKQGLPYDERLVVTPRGYRCQGGYDACTELIKRNQVMTALFCSTDSYALGACKCCRDRGISVPEDLAVMGYDNLDEAAFADVPLTTIAYNIQAETEMAIELLFRRMRDGTQMTKNENIALEPELLVRRSTAGPKESKEKK